MQYTIGNKIENTANNVSQTANTNKVGRFQNTSGASLTLTSFSGKFRAAAPSAKTKAVIYADSSGAPGALIAASNEKVGITAGQNDFTFGSTVTIDVGAWIWIGFISDTTLAAYAPSGSATYGTDTYSDGPANPFSGSSSAAYNVVAWITATDGAATLLCDSQIALETLDFPVPNVRASQVALELMYSNLRTGLVSQVALELIYSNLRFAVVSQVVMEIIEEYTPLPASQALFTQAATEIACTPEANARITNLAAEIALPYNADEEVSEVEMFYEIQFPSNIEYGVTGGAGFSTTVVTSGGGWEQRNINWAQARGAWDCAHALKTKEQITSLIGFMRLMRGRAHGFRFKDWTDYEVVEQEPEKIDGTHYQLVKRYVVAGEVTVRTIKKPVTSAVVTAFGERLQDTVQLIQDGSVIDPSTYTVDHTKGIVTLLQPLPGAGTLYASFEFDVPCRFDVDKIDASVEFYNQFAWQQIPILEIRV